MPPAPTNTMRKPSMIGKNELRSDLRNTDGGASSSNNMRAATGLVIGSLSVGRDARADGDGAGSAAGSAKSDVSASFSVDSSSKASAGTGGGTSDTAAVAGDCTSFSAVM